MRYVAGLLFDKEEKEVLLIKKIKPAWQKGKLNGVGGKIEAGESPKYAMMREFQEEAGILIVDWKRFAIIKGDWGEVHFFYQFIDDKNKPYSVEEEKIAWYPIRSLSNYPCIPNINWLVPMALNMCNVAEYSYEIKELPW